MTRVSYSKDQNGYELFVQGHAGFDMCGRDIVCSSISAICYALLGYLENYAPETSDYTTNSGELAVFSSGGEGVDAAFEMAAIGLLQIAHQHPDNLVVHISAIGGDSREETANF